MVIPEQILSRDVKPWMAGDFIPYVIRVLPEGLVSITSKIDQGLIQVIIDIGIPILGANFLGAKKKIRKKTLYVVDV